MPLTLFVLSFQQNEVFEANMATHDSYGQVESAIASYYACDDQSETCGPYCLLLLAKIPSSFYFFLLWFTENLLVCVCM